MVWPNSDTSDEYIKVILCIQRCISFFFFVYVMYPNIASYLYGKQIKSKFRNKVNSMIIICVHSSALSASGPYHDPFRFHKTLEISIPHNSFYKKKD